MVSGRIDRNGPTIVKRGRMRKCDSTVSDEIVGDTI